MFRLMVRLIVRKLDCPEAASSGIELSQPLVSSADRVPGLSWALGDDAGANKLKDQETSVLCGTDAKNCCILATLLREFSKTDIDHMNLSAACYVVLGDEIGELA
jgi:hypothetical protein